MSSPSDHEADAKHANDEQADPDDFQRVERGVAE
jgi:hypothetical protein